MLTLNWFILGFVLNIYDEFLLPYITYKMKTYVQNRFSRASAERRDPLNGVEKKSEQLKWKYRIIYDHRTRICYGNIKYQTNF